MAVDTKLSLRRISAGKFRHGDRVICRRSRWGEVSHVSRTGYVVVRMYSPSLGRFSYGTVTYHPDLLKKMVA